MRCVSHTGRGLLKGCSGLGLLLPGGKVADLALYFTSGSPAVTVDDRTGCHLGLASLTWKRLPQLLSQGAVTRALVSLCRCYSVVDTVTRRRSRVEIIQDELRSFFLTVWILRQLYLRYVLAELCGFQGVSACMPEKNPESDKTIKKKMHLCVF